MDLSDLTDVALARIKAGDGDEMIETASAFLEADDQYLGFVFASAATDHDCDEAQEFLDAMLGAEFVCDEDVLLAYYQLARWYASGTVLPHSDELARRYVDEIVGGFDEEPQLEGQTLAGDLATLQQFIGIPNGLDLSLPLGPAIPFTPANVHRRHDCPAVGARAAQWAEPPDDSSLAAAVLEFFRALAAHGADAALDRIGVAWGETGKQNCLEWLQGIVEDNGPSEPSEEPVAGSWHQRLAIPSEHEDDLAVIEREDELTSVMAPAYCDGERTDVVAVFDVREHDGHHVLILDHFRQE